MEEKTAKIKVVNINDRYITKIIQFKIDAISTDVLEVNYIIVAVNGTFSSPPIKIALDIPNICGYLLYHLYILQELITCEDSLSKDVYIQCEGIISGLNLITFERTDRVDDLGRELIEFSYVMEEVNTIDIPLEIMPAFLDTFIQILKDKDIIIEEESDECDGEHKEDTESNTVDEQTKGEITGETKHNITDN